MLLYIESYIFQGGALRLLEASSCVNWDQILEFVLTTHCPMAGGNTESLFHIMFHKVAKTKDV